MKEICLPLSVPKRMRYGELLGNQGVVAILFEGGGRGGWFETYHFVQKTLFWAPYSGRELFLNLGGGARHFVSRWRPSGFIAYFWA